MVEHGQAHTVAVRTLSFAAVLVIWSAATGRAQFVDLRHPDPAARALSDVSLTIHDERVAAGVALGVGGLFSIAVGAVTASLGHDDPFALAFGVGVLGWGGINAGLALGMLDLDGGRGRDARAVRHLRYDALDRARDRAIAAQRGAATVFAVNVGLDVFYLATGALLYLLADQLTGVNETPWMRGYATAQMSQGGFLLVLDLVEWIASEDRASRLERIEAPRW